MTNTTTKTKTGVKIDMEIMKTGRCKATAHHPTMGEITGYGKWGRLNSVEGFVMNASIKGKATNVCLEISKESFIPMEDAMKKFQADKKQARLDIESAQPQFRMLIASGGYLIDTSIATVCLQPDQSQYAAWTGGKVVMGCIEKTPIEIKGDDSPTAKAIFKRDQSGYMYGSGESAMWEITAEEEAQILAECEAAKIAKIEKEETVKKVEVDRVDTIFQTAKTTGAKQMLRSFAIDCTDPHEECNTDIVTVWAMPDGTKKETKVHTW